MASLAGGCRAQVVVLGRIFQDSHERTLYLWKKKKKQSLQKRPQHRSLDPLETLLRSEPLPSPLSSESGRRGLKMFSAEYSWVIFKLRSGHRKACSSRPSRMGTGLPAMSLFQPSSLPKRTRRPSSRQKSSLPWLAGLVVKSCSL